MSTADQADAVPPFRYRYRVVSKREGLRPKVKTFATLAAAQKRITVLTSPEPWVAMGRGPDDYVCCSGFSCGCGGATYREETQALRTQMPALLWVRLDRREVSPWQTIETLKP